MVGLRARHFKWQAYLRIPKALRDSYGGRQFLYETLKATDKRAAQIEGMAWEVGVRAEWAARTAVSPATSIRHLYETFRAGISEADFAVDGDPHAFDKFTAGIDYELEKIAEAVGTREMTEPEQAKVWALNDAAALHKGREVPLRASLEPRFSELATDYMRLWRKTAGLKKTNTGQQKQATLDLFASFIQDKPIRQVRPADAAQFVDALRELDPNWARTGRAREEGEELDWRAIQRQFGGRATGLSDATVNRHVAALAGFWEWSAEREHCEGRNPFKGHSRNLKQGRNKHGYVAWELDEVQELFSPPPKRRDLMEAMLVAMFTGMRRSEIASLTFGQIRCEDGVGFIDVTDAKTVAGVRRVPLHPKLSWLTNRAEKADDASRIWPEFSSEGPGNHPGGDLGKLFTAHKSKRGFKGGLKVFHSFRKNFVGQLERKGVPQNEVAQLVGHEKRGLTFGVYGTNLTPQRGAELVALIDYPGVNLPQPGDTP